MASRSDAARRDNRKLAILSVLASLRACPNLVNGSFAQATRDPFSDGGSQHSKLLLVATNQVTKILAVVRVVAVCDLRFDPFILLIGINTLEISALSDSVDRSRKGR